MTDSFLLFPRFFSHVSHPLYRPAALKSCGALASGASVCAPDTAVLALSLVTVGELGFLAAVVGYHERGVTRPDAFAAVSLALFASNVLGPLALRLALLALRLRRARSARSLQRAASQTGHAAAASAATAAAAGDDAAVLPQAQLYELKLVAATRWGLSSDVRRALARAQLEPVELRASPLPQSPEFTRYEALLRDASLAAAPPTDARAAALVQARGRHSFQRIITPRIVDRALTARSPLPTPQLLRTLLPHDLVPHPAHGAPPAAADIIAGAQHAASASPAAGDDAGGPAHPHDTVTPSVWLAPWRPSPPPPPAAAADDAGGARSSVRLRGGARRSASPARSRGRAPSPARGGATRRLAAAEADAAFSAALAEGAAARRADVEAEGDAGLGPYLAWQRSGLGGRDVGGDGDADAAAAAADVESSLPSGLRGGVSGRLVRGIRRSLSCQVSWPPERNVVDPKT